MAGSWAAREAIVLVKNGGASAAAAAVAAETPSARNGKQQLLPMTASSLTKVAVVGPSADSPSAYIGDYAPQPACEPSVCHTSVCHTSVCLTSVCLTTLPHSAATPVWAIPNRPI